MNEPEAIYRDGKRLDHAEAASRPLRFVPEKQPRGAKVRSDWPADQGACAHASRGISRRGRGEYGFRHYMASVGIDVIETDIGERIQQLDNEHPSHVVVPAVHKLITDVADVFSRTIATDPGNSEVR